MTRSCGIVLFALAKALSSVGRFLRGSSVPTVRMKGRLIRSAAGTGRGQARSAL